MQRDGNIDYRAYTLAELKDALSTIDGARYPLNLMSLLAEIATRPEPLPEPILAPPEAEPRAATNAAAAVPAELVHRTFWRRLTARIIDVLLLWPLQWLPGALDADLWPAAPRVLLHALLWSLPLVYIGYFVSRHGATIGKMMAGVNVTSVSARRSPTLAEALLREIGPVVHCTLLVLCLILVVTTGRYTGYQSLLQDTRLGQVLVVLVTVWYTLDALIIWTNPKRRALHDYIARTVVVRVD
jgi:uncharacterized RDD family membrane protein YckC